MKKGLMFSYFFFVQLFQTLFNIIVSGTVYLLYESTQKTNAQLSQDLF